LLILISLPSNEYLLNGRLGLEYLKTIFSSKNIAYTKKNPGEAQKEYYLNELIKRIKTESQHLKTFQ
jgi:hypothetical protein